MIGVSVAALDAAPTPPSAEAERWVGEWARRNDGTIAPALESAALTEEFIARIQEHGVWSKDPVTSETLPALPSGAELVYFHGPVRRGFVMKLGEAAWAGFSEAGNGTRTLAWPVTQVAYERLTEAVRRAKRN